MVSILWTHLAAFRIASAPALGQHTMELYVHDSVLLWGFRVAVLPKESVLSDLHTGHQRTVKTQQVARSFIWWPSIDSAVEIRCSLCQRCARTLSNPSKAQPHPRKWPSQLWERIHIDIAGPFMGSMWLIIADTDSKRPKVFQMSSTTSRKLWLPSVKSFPGLVFIELVSDNGPVRS